jgi:hypothetical protein
MIDPQGHVGDDPFRRYSTSRSIAKEEDRLTAARIGFKQTRDVAYWPQSGHSSCSL